MSTVFTPGTLSVLQQRLIGTLADGGFHSGTKLGTACNVSRAAVNKALSTLAEYGLEISAVKGRGYRLVQSLQLLDREAIMAHLSAASRQRLAAIHVLSVVDSTNAYLMRNTLAPSACLAEYQTAGRGRRGRRWISPYGSNIYLSLRWSFEEGMARLSGLSLAIAVAVLRALKDCGVDEAGLKWPNDILWAGRKLGGILLEVSGESAGPCHVVVGIGLNMFMSPRMAAAIDQPWVCLDELKPGIARNHIAARLIEQLLEVLSVFEREGLRPFVEEWRAADCFAGHAVTLSLPDEQLAGICRGIAADGELLLEVAGVLRSFSYGEVSMRRAGVGA